MKVAKKFNEIYGGAFVESIVNIIVKSNKYNHYRSNPNILQDLKEIEQDAKILYDNCNLIKNSKVSITQQNTKNSNCDLLTEYDETLEIKYVGSEGSSGTYFNTTLYYFEKVLHYKSIGDFLKENNYYDFLIELKLNPNTQNTSPFTIEESKKIMENEILYNTITEKEKIIRKSYRDYIFTMLNKNNEDKIKFINDMITKESSGKIEPDYVIVFNYSKKIYDVIPTQNLLKRIDKIKLTPTGQNSLLIEISGDNSIVVPKLFRATFAWQNGTGLNNPTIRVFLV